MGSLLREQVPHCFVSELNSLYHPSETGLGVEHLEGKRPSMSGLRPSGRPSKTTLGSWKSKKSSNISLAASAKMNRYLHCIRQVNTTCMVTHTLTGLGSAARVAALCPITPEASLPECSAKE